MSGLQRYLTDTDPVDHNALSSATTTQEWNQAFFGGLQQANRIGGFANPTEGLMNKVNYSSDTETAFGQVKSSIMNHKGPAAFDTNNDTYRQNRFDFISGEENFSNNTYTLYGVKHIGYGMNLEANAGLVKETLNLTDKQFAEMLAGTRGVNEQEGRMLFDAAVMDAERVVQSKLEGVELNASQRVALVSMAYNAPALIGPNITAALKSGDFASVSDEILNKSNGNKLKALDYRRKREHDMFFGYDEQFTALNKGDTMNKDKGFNFASMLGISTAQAGEAQASPVYPDYELSRNPNPGIVSSVEAMVEPITSANPYSDERRARYLEDYGSLPFYFPSEESMKKGEAYFENADELRNMPLPKPKPKRFKDQFGNPAIGESNAQNYEGEFFRIPSNVKATLRYLRDGVIGDDIEDTYTEDSFSKSELGVIKDIVTWAESKGKKSITYRDYDEFFGPLKINGLYPSEIVAKKTDYELLRKKFKERGIDRPDFATLMNGVYGENKQIAMARMALDSRDPVMAVLLTIASVNFYRDDNNNLVIKRDRFDFPKNRSTSTAFNKFRTDLNDQQSNKARLAFELNLGS